MKFKGGVGLARAAAASSAREKSCSSRETTWRGSALQRGVPDSPRNLKTSFQNQDRELAFTAGSSRRVNAMQAGGMWRRLERATLASASTTHVSAKKKCPGGHTLVPFATDAVFSCSTLQAHCHAHFPRPSPLRDASHSLHFLAPPSRSPPAPIVRRATPLPSHSFRSSR